MKAARKQKTEFGGLNLQERVHVPQNLRNKKSCFSLNVFNNRHGFYPLNIFNGVLHFYLFQKMEVKHYCLACFATILDRESRAHLFFFSTLF